MKSRMGEHATHLLLFIRSLSFHVCPNTDGDATYFLNVFLHILYLYLNLMPTFFVVDKTILYSRILCPSSLQSYFNV